MYLDKLLIWVIITVRLLCLRFDENRFMGSMREHPKKGHFRLFGPRVCNLFRSNSTLCNEGDLSVSTARNNLPRVTHDTFFDIPYDFGIFRTRGSVPQLCFSKLQSRGKILICKRWR